MISVKFFGKIRLEVGVEEYQATGEYAKLKTLLEELGKEFNMEYKELKKCVIFIDGTPFTKLGMYRASLKGVKEVAMLSPVSGG